MTLVRTSESQTQTLTTHNTAEAAVTDSPPTDPEFRNASQMAIRQLKLEMLYKRDRFWNLKQPLLQSETTW